MLSRLETISQMDLSDITDGFPYPQVFVLPNITIVCGRTNIYEWVSELLVLKLTVDAGIRWSVIAFADYIYMTNSTVSVVRDSNSKEYSLSELPAGSCLCDFNGQVFIGSPKDIL